MQPIDMIEKKEKGLFEESLIECNGNDLAAITSLALKYIKGSVVDKDLKRAAVLMVYAAEQGNPCAQYNLGLMYENGDAVPHDNKKSVDFFRLSANQRYTKALKAYAFCLLYGIGLEKPDYAGAVKYYELALKDTDSEVNKDHLSEAYHRYAEELCKVVKFDEAEQNYLKSVEAKGKYSIGSSYRVSRLYGCGYTKAGVDESKASVYFGRALDAQLPEACITYASKLARQGDECLTEAIKYCDSAMQHELKSEEAKSKVGEIYFKYSQKLEHTDKNESMRCLIAAYGLGCEDAKSRLAEIKNKSLAEAKGQTGVKPATASSGLTASTPRVSYGAAPASAPAPVRRGGFRGALASAVDSLRMRRSGYAPLGNNAPKER